MDRQTDILWANDGAKIGTQDTMDWTVVKKKDIFFGSTKVDYCLCAESN